MKVLYAIAALLLMGLTADAGCRVVHRAAAVQYAVPAVAVAAFIPVAVPAYGVGGHARDDSDVLRELQALRDELKSYLPQKAAKPVSVLESRCAQCHTGAKVKGGFTLDLSKMSTKDAFRITREIFSGRMPKNGKLSQDEMKSISDFLDTIK